MTHPGSPGEGAVGLRCLASAYTAVWENSVCSQCRPEVVPLASMIPSHVHGALQFVMGHMHAVLPHSSPTTRCCKGELHVTGGQSLGLLNFPVSSRLITFPSVSPVLPPSLLPGSFQGTSLALCSLTCRFWLSPLEPPSASAVSTTRNENIAGAHLLLMLPNQTEQ